MKISKFTKINKQIIFSSAKQTLIMTLKFVSNLFYDLLYINKYKSMFPIEKIKPKKRFLA